MDKIALLRRITAVSSVLFCVACKNPEPPPPDYESLRRKEPLSETFNVNYLRTENGRPKAHLKAPHVFDRYAAKEGDEVASEMDRGIDLEFFDSTGKQDSRLTAQKAIFYEKRGYAEAMGSVVVVNDKNERLETEHLRWNRANNTLTTGAFVKIIRPDEIIFGDSLQANQNFSVYRIFKMKGSINLKE